MSGDEPSALFLLAWLSPSFPVGAFAYSHGLESAVDAGLVRDAESLEGWLRDLLRHGSARQDAVLAAEAWRLARDRGDEAGLAELNDLALALAPSRERRLEAGGTGRAFADAIRDAWPAGRCPALPGGDVAYPVAFGAAAGAAGLPLADSLQAQALAFAANLVSAAVRLGAIGQTAGQRVTAALLPEAGALGARAAASTLDDLGGCALVSDVCAMAHETLYSRLFRS